MNVEIPDGALATDTHRSLAAELAPIERLSDVLKWARDRSPTARLLVSVAQDEFSHDIVFEFGTNRWLVFDAT